MIKKLRIWLLKRQLIRMEEVLKSLPANTIARPYTEKEIDHVLDTLATLDKGTTKFRYRAKGG